MWKWPKARSSRFHGLRFRPWSIHKYQVKRINPQQSVFAALLRVVYVGEKFLFAVRAAYVKV